MSHSASTQRSSLASPTRESGYGSDTETMSVCSTSLGENSMISIPDPPSALMQSVNHTDKPSLSILQSMGQALHVFDRKVLIVYWNPSAEHLYGYSPSEALGRSPLGLIIEECDFKEANEIIRRNSFGQIWTGNFPVMNKQGHRFQVYSNLTPLYDDYGVFVGVMCLTFDPQSFLETQTLFSGAYVSGRTAYPCSSGLSRGDQIMTDGVAQKKQLQVAMSSKVLNLTSRRIKKAWTKMRTCIDKPMTHETHDGDSLYVDHRGILETVCTDDDDDKEEKHRESSLERAKIILGSAKKTRQGSEAEKLATMVNGDKDATDVEGVDGIADGYIENNASQVEVQDNNDPVDEGWKIAKEKISSANKNIVEDDDRKIMTSDQNIEALMKFSNLLGIAGNDKENEMKIFGGRRKKES